MRDIFCFNTSIAYSILLISYKPHTSIKPLPIDFSALKLQFAFKPHIHIENLLARSADAAFPSDTYGRPQTHPNKRKALVPSQEIDYLPTEGKQRFLLMKWQAKDWMLTRRRNTVD